MLGPPDHAGAHPKSTSMLGPPDHAGAQLPDGGCHTCFAGSQ